MRKVITQQELFEILHYDPVTGEFKWLKVNAHNTSLTDPVGSVSKRDGYRRIRINGQFYLAHRLAWLYVTGKFPSGLLDHKNGQCADNRFDNLREATRAENGWNVGLKKTNSSGYKGVDWYKRYNKWRARCRYNGAQHLLGYFDLPEEAAAAYEDFAVKHHGEFYRDTQDKA